MPSTEIKNLAYRVAVPLFAPRLQRHPELEVEGGSLYTQEKYIHLLKKHHVLGSAMLLKNSTERISVLCSSLNPSHPVAINSYFRIASITKMATSLAVMIAAEQNILSLSEPVLSFFDLNLNIPELKDVTLSHLLSHTSGLQDPPGMEEALLHSLPFPEIISGCRVSEPGSCFRYSNFGFGLIGCILENVYQLPVSMIFQNLIFSPLGMSATLDASELSPEKIVPITRVLPYHPGTDLRITPLGSYSLTEPSPLSHYGHTAGAMYVDLPSLEKLTDCLMHDGKPLLKTDLGKQMKTEHSSYGKISPTLSYGLGILRIQDSSISSSVILGHQGFAYGCADGAFWEEETGSTLLFLNGGASEARRGRLGLCNYDMLKWAFRKEMPHWNR